MSAFFCSVRMLERMPFDGRTRAFVPDPYFGDGYEVRDVEREGAIRTLVEWFDLEQMAIGLRSVSGVWEAHVARVREELLAKNQHLVTRWWNRRAPW